MNIEYSAKAAKNMVAIYHYIAEKGYPDTASKYIERMFGFIESLTTMPDKYKLCSRQSWTKRKLRCAVFEDTYVIAYKVASNESFLIFDIVHGKVLG